MNPYLKLTSYILPQEINESFELKEVIENESGLHIYLEEKGRQPEGYGKLQPNGFYEETQIRDFPIRDRKVTLHVKRRRWKDSTGKSISKDWELVAKGTRHSKEFAAFLKGMLGEIPDYGPLS
jgi:hypothetical protein